MGNNQTLQRKIRWPLLTSSLLGASRGAVAATASNLIGVVVSLKLSDTSCVIASCIFPFKSWGHDVTKPISPNNIAHKFFYYISMWLNACKYQHVINLSYPLYVAIALVLFLILNLLMWQNRNPKCNSLGPTKYPIWYVHFISSKLYHNILLIN